MSFLVSAVSLSLFATSALAAEQKFLNVSYDPTRELYKDYNTLFAKVWKEKAAADVQFDQSHGGSSKQARSVIDGLEADVVTLALGYDIDIIAKAGLLSPDWQKALPNNSTPYTSTIVFLVRKGNPKGIKDWADLVKDGVEVVTPNPKTSGGARWNILAAYGWARKALGGEAQAKEYLGKLIAHVPVFDSGARGSLTTFTERGTGDVLLSWENEALLAIKELGPDKFEIITPSTSILAEPPVAVVEAVAKKHGTTELAKAYLEYLYTEPAQELIAQHFYRPRSEAVAKKYASSFAQIPLFTIDAEFGGWQKAQKEFFAEGGLYDQLQQK